MRILTLNYEYPPLGGGAGLITQHICKGLCALGHDITVITAGIGTNTGIAHEDGISILRLPSKRRYEYKSDITEMLSWIKYAKKEALDFCNNKKPHIIFSHFALPGGEVAAYLKKRTGIPYVIMSHGHDIPWFDPKQMFFYHLITYYRIKRIYNNCSALFLQSDFTKKNADRFSGPGKTNKNIVIPNGCDTEKFPVSGHSKSNILRIFTGGRMVGQKETMTLLRSLPLLRSEGILFHLTIAGDGPLLPKLKKYCRNNKLGEFVTFTGWLKKSEINGYLASTDVFVLPSRAEGMSISLLEAMCSGIYVIVTPVSGSSDLVTNGVNGSFFPLRDHKALAKELVSFSKIYCNSYPLKSEDVIMFREKYNWANISKMYDRELKRITG